MLLGCKGNTVLVWNLYMCMYNTHTVCRQFSGSVFLSHFFQAHTQEGSQAVMVRLYGSPARHEHMEDSSSLQLLEWSFSPCPTEILSVMRGWHFTRWTLVCEEKLLFVVMCVCLHNWKSVCVCVCLCVWTVNTSLRDRETAVRTAGESDGDSLFHLNTGIYTPPKAQTHTDTQCSVPRWTCICMQSCTNTHKGLFHLHSLHHAF